ncbi:MAG: hypothetical protein PW735_04125 [Acidobacteriaceae bacterium]|nr:hypothetical protein [Acidobacteriaceae bacterium]
MWPKVLAQLLELLPHAARLLPLADRFLAQRANQDEATREAIEALRSDLGQNLTTHESLYRQLNEHSELLQDALQQARAAKAAAELSAERLTALERKVSRQSTFLVLLLSLCIVLLACVLFFGMKH